MKCNHHILVDKPLPQEQSPLVARAKFTAGSLHEVSWNLTLGDSCVHQDHKQNHRYGDHFRYESGDSKDTFHCLHTFPHPTKSRTPQQTDCLLPTAVRWQRLAANKTELKSLIRKIKSAPMLMSAHVSWKQIQQSLEGKRAVKEYPHRRPNVSASRYEWKRKTFFPSRLLLTESPGRINR